MPQLNIQLSEERHEFRPGETIQGRFSWELEKDADVELRLIWFTQGKGTQDVGIIQTQRVERPPMAGEEAFKFILPNGPYSFTGKLITLAWALELVTIPGDEAQRVDFTLSPTGHWVVLPAVLAGWEKSNP